ncbi:extracellular solute-binding protein [Paenibacillus koleovorans]|uniref:extracellular solute-binding protein n=1 Tax=Paenibacillus koleovorans TaxID=121608 RepID=UPI0027D82CD4|nr:extracellular solute-binding protein [Paenibacillus koleovorans]
MFNLNNKLKLLLPLSVTLAIVGCSVNNGGSPNGSSVPTAATSSPSASGSKLTANGETLSFAVIDIGPDGPSYNNDNLPIIKELEKQTGVKVKFEAVYTDYSTIMRTRIAAANNLPDIIQLPQGDDPVKIAKGGVILKLNDLIEKHAPNTKKFLDSNPDIKKALTAPDGAIYALPGIVSPAGNDYNVLGLGYREDWAKKLNLKAPETIEDWYKMLRAFRDGDPNGNGKNDEIPFAASGIGALERFAQSYGMMPMSSYFAVDKQGKVEFTWMNSKAKDYLAEMNKWYQEKLIDQGLLTPHADKVTAYVVGDISGGYSIWAARFDQYTKEMEKNFPGASWVVTAPPRGPHGDQNYEVNPALDGNRYAITKNAKNPELAIRWLDYIFASEPGQLLFNYGIEGVTYTMVNGKPQYTAEVTNNPKYPNPSSVLGTYGSGGRFPQIIPPDALSQQSKILMPEASMKRLQDIKKYYRPVFPPVMSTPEESTAYSQKMADINTYRQEMVAKFITGTEPLSNFDKFVSTLKTMGIDEVIKIKQAQYDRWNSIK